MGALGRANCCHAVIEYSWITARLDDDYLAGLSRLDGRRLCNKFSKVPSQALLLREFGLATVARTLN